MRTERSEPCDLPAKKKSLIAHGPPLTTNHADEEDHLVSEALTEGSEAGALLLLLGKMLFLTHSAKGNPLGGLYILRKAEELIKQHQLCQVRSIKTKPPDFVP